MLKTGVLLMIALGAGTLSAEFVPTSNCTENGGTPSGGVTCNLYPSDGSGNFSGDVIINFPMGFVTAATPGPGYLIFDSNPSAINYVDPTTGITGDQNTADWAQVLQFTPNAGGGYVAGNMELFTAGCGSGLTNPNDRSCFPTYTQLVAADVNYMNGISGGEPYAFLNAPAPGGVYDYTCSSPGCNTYFVNNITPQIAAGPATPEPSTFVIGALGMVVVAGWRRKVR